VSTRVGDAPSYYLRAELRHLCVPPGAPTATAEALARLAAAYVERRGQFAANGVELRARHAAADEALAALLSETLAERR
jgi:hypothetical protein